MSEFNLCYQTFGFMTMQWSNNSRLVPRRSTHSPWPRAEEDPGVHAIPLRQWQEGGVLWRPLHHQTGLRLWWHHRLQWQLQRPSDWETPVEEVHRGEAAYVLLRQWQVRPSGLHFKGWMILCITVISVCLLLPPLMYITLYLHLSRFMPPDDPLGRNGPTIDNFLRKKSRAPDIKQQHCPYGWLTFLTHTHNAWP